MDTKITERIVELLDYVRHVGKLNQKPIFKIKEYGHLNIWEHQLKGRVGIQHNVTDSEGTPIWLRIERLKRIAPPSVPERIQEWVAISNDPKSYPQITDKLIITLSEKEAKKLIEDGVISDTDVRDPLKPQGQGIKSKDVIFRLENSPAIKNEIDTYLNEQWLPWSEEEKPRRETIKFYDSLFSLQQTIEAQGDEQPIELIWGIGIARWVCEGHEIDYPLLEKPVEIEVSREDGAILIHPRNIEPSLAVGAYFALDNPGVDVLLRFEKKHFSELSEDVEFSPYIHESFEPILRQASTHLSERGLYWPDVNPNKENREPNKAGKTLEVTDSWVIYARPRSVTGFVQDIERFQKKIKEQVDVLPPPTKKLVTELSDKKPLITGSGISSESTSSSSSIPKKEKFELFFPKPFNDAQVQIIERLEKSDGVVVQGPPGTGKTHTIANIICHYLATGRSVLVTSKGESALSVLQEQIPKELRSLTISLLTNERQGMKQLEAAVQLLAGLVSQTNLRDLKLEAESGALRVKQLEKEIRQIDNEIKEWGLKQLTPVDMKLSGLKSGITAMELAEQVMNDTGCHEWLPDKLGPSERYNPKFCDSDIAKIRTARRHLGEDITYVDKRIPKPQDLLDSANIVAVHDDLVASTRIAEDTEKNHIPPLAVSVDKSIDRAKSLIKPLNNLLELLRQIDDSKWVGRIFYSWIGNSLENSEDIALFDDLKSELYNLIQQRQQFVKTLVEINDPSSCMEHVLDALKNLIDSKKPFGLLTFGNKEAKAIIQQVHVGGSTPVDTTQWQLVLDYVIFQENMRKFIINWNHIGQELELPELVYTYGSLFKDLQYIHSVIKKAEQTAKAWKGVKEELIELFPHGIDADKIPENKSEVDKAIQAIELNTSRIRLGAQRLKLKDLTEKLKQSEGEVSEKIRCFIEYAIGNSSYSSDRVIQEWQSFITELERLQNISIDLQKIEAISERIADSGAPK